MKSPLRDLFFHKKVSETRYTLPGLTSSKHDRYLYCSVLGRSLFNSFKRNNIAHKLGTSEALSRLLNYTTKLQLFTVIRALCEHARKEALVPATACGPGLYYDFL